MDEETRRCKVFVKAILTTAIRDMVLPYGENNSRLNCREAFNFIANQKNDSYKDFLYWCDLANLDPYYWHRLALMNLAYELCNRPWLRTRVISFLKGKENRWLLHKYYNQYQLQKNNHAMEEKNGKIIA